MEKIEEIKEMISIEEHDRIVNDVMDESMLFNKTLIEVADKLVDLMICEKLGYTAEGLFNKASEIFKFIAERYDELPYSNNGDYFQAMLSKLQQDK